MKYHDRAPTYHPSKWQDGGFMRIDHASLCGAILLLSLNPAAAQQSIHWQPTLESAQRLAAQTDRWVLAHFWADWCAPCKRMEQEILNQPSVAVAVHANYVPVKINTKHFPATCRQFDVTALPTDLILTPEGQIVERLQGGSSAAAYVAQLNRSAARARAPSTPAYAQAPGSARPPTRRTQPHEHLAAARPRLADGLPGHESAAYRGPGGTDASPGAPPLGAGQGASPWKAEQPSSPPAGGPPGTSLPPKPAPTGARASGPGPTAVGTAGSPETPIPGSWPAAAQASQGEPLCLEGYCPVELCENNAWIMGDPRHGVRHLGRTYLFSGPEQAQRFWANPDRYAPVNSGYDVVLFLEEGQRVAGRRRYGVFFGEQIYLFANEATRERFERNPHRYASLLEQAMRAQARAPQQAY